MKTKLTLLLAMLAVGGIASTAQAGPDMLALELRKQIADSHRASLVAVTQDSGVPHYVASPSGKGGVVTRKDGPTTNIAVFKSSKMKKGNCDDAACCAKAKSHSH
jgi:hypothetical protein